MLNISPEIYLRLALGLGFLAFGWTLFRFGLRATGFGLGYVFGSSVYELVVTWVGIINPEWLRFFPDHPYTAFFVGIVTGIIGVLLAKRMYVVLIFIGSLSGALYILYADDQQRLLVEKLFSWIGILEPINNTLGNAWPAVLALLIALLFIYFQKQVIVLLTTCLGAYIISDTIDIPVLFLPLCFIGYLLQQTKRPRRKVKKEEEE